MVYPWNNPWTEKPASVNMHNRSQVMTKLLHKQVINYIWWMGGNMEEDVMYKMIYNTRLLFNPLGYICGFIGSDNGLLPHDTQILPKPIVTYYHWDPGALTRGQFHKRYLSHQLLNLDRNFWNLTKISLKSPMNVFWIVYTKNSPIANVP